MGLWELLALISRRMSLISQTLEQCSAKYFLELGRTPLMTSIAYEQKDTALELITRGVAIQTKKDFVNQIATAEGEKSRTTGWSASGPKKSHPPRPQ